jgi:hypothetical protein
MAGKKRIAKSSPFLSAATKGCIISFLDREGVDTEGLVVGPKIHQGHAQVIHPADQRPENMADLPTRMNDRMHGIFHLNHVTADEVPKELLRHAGTGERGGNFHARSIR